MINVTAASYFSVFLRTDLNEVGVNGSIKDLFIYLFIFWITFISYFVMRKNTHVIW